MAAFTDTIIPMHPKLIEQACNLYQTTPESLTPLSGGHYNAVYRYPLPKAAWGNKSTKTSNFGVLRLGKEDCPTSQTLGMMDWVNYLSAHGAPVTAPIPSTRGRLVERLAQDGTFYIATSFEEANGILAERIPPDEWTNELFKSIGQAAGKVHAVSKCYQPPDASFTRPQWFESSEIHDALERLTSAADPVADQLMVLIKDLQRLPSPHESFGLIHGDLHFANFLVQPGGEVTIIDFDDCVYGWFAMDIAMAVFDVLILYPGDLEQEKQTFARRYLQHYLAGYRMENLPSPYWLEQIPHFLKLKELCIYAPLIGHPDINLPETWVGRFMQGRAQRIKNDVPYVDLDFSNL